MKYEINHFPERNLFVTEVDGITAYVEYIEDNGTFNIIHTIVPMPIEGRGIAATLCKTAYNYARDKGLKPIGNCSYASMWLNRHPEYKD